MDICLKCMQDRKAKIGLGWANGDIAILAGEYGDAVEEMIDCWTDPEECPVIALEDLPEPTGKIPSWCKYALEQTMYIDEGAA